MLETKADVPRAIISNPNCLHEGLGGLRYPKLLSELTALIILLKTPKQYCPFIIVLLVVSDL